MSVLEKVKLEINSLEFLMFLLGASLSLLLIGYTASSVALGVFCVFSLRYFILNPIKLRFDLALFLPIVLYIYFMSSYFWSVNKEQTIKGLGRMVVLSLVPIAFSFLPKISLKNYRIVLKFFTKSNALLGVFFLVNALIKVNGTQSIKVFTYHELVSILDLNAIYVTLIFSVSFFYLVSLKRKTVLEKGMTVFFLIFIFLLSAKFIIFVLFLGLLIFLYKNKLNSWNKKKIILLLVVVFIGLSIGSINLSQRIAIEKKTEFNEILSKETFGKVYYWTGSSIRLFQLRILKEQIQEESIAINGFGLFASKHNLVKRHLQYDTYFKFHEYNYHNQYAQILAETGLLGLLLFIVMLVHLFYKALKSKDYAFLMFAIMMATIFLTESVLWRQRGLFLFVILFCLYHRVLFNSKSITS